MKNSPFNRTLQYWMTGKLPKKTYCSKPFFLPFLDFRFFYSNCLTFELVIESEKIPLTNLTFCVGSFAGRDPLTSSSDCQSCPVSWNSSTDSLTLCILTRSVCLDVPLGLFWRARNWDILFCELSFANFLNPPRWKTFPTHLEVIQKFLSDGDLEISGPKRRPLSWRRCGNNFILFIFITKWP